MLKLVDTFEDGTIYSSVEGIPLIILGVLCAVGALTILVGVICFFVTVSDTNTESRTARENTESIIERLEKLESKGD